MHIRSSARIGPKALKVLIIENNGGVALFIQELLRNTRQPKFEFAYESHFSSALTRLRNERFDVVILDYGLTWHTDAGALTKIEIFSPETAVVLLTDRKREGPFLADHQRNVYPHLTKGKFDAEVLTETLGEALARKRSHALSPD